MTFAAEMSGKPRIFDNCSLRDPFRQSRIIGVAKFVIPGPQYADAQTLV